MIEIRVDGKKVHTIKEMAGDVAGLEISLDSTTKGKFDRTEIAIPIAHDVVVDLTTKMRAPTDLELLEFKARHNAENSRLEEVAETEKQLEEKRAEIRELHKDEELSDEEVDALIAAESEAQDTEPDSPGQPEDKREENPEANVPNTTHEGTATLTETKEMGNTGIETEVPANSEGVTADQVDDLGKNENVVVGVDRNDEPTTTEVKVDDEHKHEGSPSGEGPLSI